MRRLVIVTLCAGIAACSTPIDAPMSPTFGEAKASMKEQVIARGPPSDLPPTSSGVRGAAAMDRYLKGHPKQPPVQSTSDLQPVLGPIAPAAAPPPGPGY